MGGEDLYRHAIRIVYMALASFNHVRRIEMKRK